jgi:hypothetical protein
MNPPLDEFLMSSYGTVLNDKKSWLQIWDEIIIEILIRIIMLLDLLTTLVIY